MIGVVLTVALGICILATLLCIAMVIGLSVKLRTRDREWR